MTSTSDPDVVIASVAARQVFTSTSAVHDLVPRVARIGPSG